MKTKEEKGKAIKNGRMRSIQKIAVKIARSEGCDMPVAMISARKQYNGAIQSKAKATRVKNRKARLEALQATQKKTQEKTQEKKESQSLLFIADHPAKKMIYQTLIHEATTLDGPLHAITMPSENTEFEKRLHKQGAKLTFIEKDATIAKKIRRNFNKVPHTLVTGTFPNKTKAVRSEYAMANFIWLDFMGRFLPRYQDEIGKLMQDSIREDMVFAITIGQRGNTGVGNFNQINHLLTGVFTNFGWKESHFSFVRYKSSKGSPMTCLIYRLTKDANIGKAKNYNPKLEEKKKEYNDLLYQLRQLQQEMEKLKSEVIWQSTNRLSIC